MRAAQEGEKEGAASEGAAARPAPRARSSVSASGARMEEEGPVRPQALAKQASEGAASVTGLAAAAAPSATPAAPSPTSRRDIGGAGRPAVSSVARYARSLPPPSSVEPFLRPWSDISRALQRPASPAAAGTAAGSAGAQPPPTRERRGSAARLEGPPRPRLASVDEEEKTPAARGDASAAEAALASAGRRAAARTDAGDGEEKDGGEDDEDGEEEAEEEEEEELFAFDEELERRRRRADEVRRALERRAPWDEGPLPAERPPPEAPPRMVLSSSLPVRIPLPRSAARPEPREPAADSGASDANAAAARQRDPFWTPAPELDIPKQTRTYAFTLLD